MGKNLLAVAISATILAGCNVSGVAEKGPFQEGSTVTATVLNNDATLSSTLVFDSNVTDEAGSYSVETNLRGNVWLQMEATGNYFNELTGVTSNEALSLKATTRANNAFNRVNINLFSHLVSARIQQRVADGSSLRRAYNQSELDLRNVFGISRLSTSLSLADGRSRRRQDNANLALFSGAFSSTEDSVTALENLTEDFADDGLFNGVGADTFGVIALKSAEEGLLTTIRENLIANGASNPPDEADLGDLPSWVDTEGEDPVIVNTAPIAEAGTAQVDEDGSIAIPLLATDADGDALSYTATTAANGSVSVDGNIATYTPTENFFGSDSFSFTVNDGELSASADVTVEVVSVDDLPTAEDINAGTVIAGQSTSVFLEGADIDSEISYTVSNGSLGTVVLNEAGEAGMTAVYTAGAIAGNDSFSYQVTGDDQFVSATVSVVVEPLPVPQGELLGAVRDINGNVIEGVTVDVLIDNTFFGEPIEVESTGEVGSYTVVTDANGQFTVAADADSARVLALRKDGYADQIVPVWFLEGSAPLNVVMIQRGEVQTIDASVGGAVTGSDGATVFVDANMFVNAAGEPVTGDIQVTVTPLDVSNEALLAAFPGDFYGISGSEGFFNTIATLGTTEFVFTQNGEVLEVAPERVVDIMLPIYNEVNPATGDNVAVGDEIALWSLNELSGIWYQEGEGTVVASRNSPTGFALAAEVSHFTWWNVDVAVDPSGLTVQVNPPVYSDGTEIPSNIGTLYARAKEGFGWRASQVDAILNVGESSEVFGLPANVTICFWFEYAVNAGGTINTDQQCVDTQSFESYNLTFDATVPTDTLALKMQGEPTITVLPTTIETSVDYTIASGSLPLGMSLVQVSNTTAELQGNPVEAGVFEVVIQGTDSEGNVSSVTNYFDIPDAGSPVLVGTGLGGLDLNSIHIYEEQFATYDTEAVEIDLNAYNVGGIATSWTHSLPDSPDYPFSVTISESGILSFTNRGIPEIGSLVSESFAVRAANASGESEELFVSIEIFYAPCFINNPEAEEQVCSTVPVLQ